MRVWYLQIFVRFRFCVLLRAGFFNLQICCLAARQLLRFGLAQKIIMSKPITRPPKYWLWLRKKWMRALFDALIGRLQREEPMHLLNYKYWYTIRALWKSVTKCRARLQYSRARLPSDGFWVKRKNPNWNRLDAIGSLVWLERIGPKINIPSDQNVKKKSSGNGLLAAINCGQSSPSFVVRENAGSKDR